MKVYSMNCRANHVEVSLKGVVVKRFKTYIKFHQWFSKFDHHNCLLMASSDMDFPQEYTKRKKIINLCRKIMNG